MYPLQRGFRPGRSCETQLFEMVNQVVDNMQLGLQTDICVLDFSKAFDEQGGPQALSGEAKNVRYRW